MLERIGKVENIPAFVEGVKNRKEKMFGFGHRSARRGGICCSASNFGHRSARKGNTCCSAFKFGHRREYLLLSLRTGFCLDGAKLAWDSKGRTL